jgi:hypothetical protein
MGLQLLQQSGNDPKALRSGLDTFKKGYMLDSTIASRAKEAADTAKAQAETQKTQQETQFYQGLGLAPGVTPDMAAYASYLGKGGKPEGWAGFKAQQEAAATQPFKIQTAMAEARAKQLLEGLTVPGYAYDPATNTTKLTDQTAYLQAGGRLQGFRKIGEKDVREDTMLINRLGDVHQKLAEYQQTLQKPISAKDQGNMAALLGTQGMKLGAFGTEIPMDRVNAALNKENLQGLSAHARDQLVAYRNMRDALLGYKTVLSGSARGSDKQMELLDQAIPIPSITDPDFSKRSLDAFKQNLHVVGQGLPVLPGIKSPQQIEQEVQDNSDSQPQINGRLSDLLNNVR